jgi:hypothetical protein
MSTDKASPKKPGRPRIERTAAPSNAEFDDVVRAIAEIPPKLRPRIKERALLEAGSDRQLSGASLAVLQMLIAGLDWRTGMARLSAGLLAQRLGLHVRTVRKATTLGRNRGHLLQRRKWKSLGPSKDAYNDTSESTFPGIARAALAIGEEAGEGVVAEKATSAQERPVREELLGLSDRPKRPPLTGPSGHHKSSYVCPYVETNVEKEEDARERARTVSGFSNSGDRGQTVPLESAQPQPEGTTLAESKTGSPGGCSPEDLPLTGSAVPAESDSLPERYPFAATDPVTEQIRKRGGSPDALWAKYRQLALAGKIKPPDDVVAYLIGMAAKETRKAAERIGGRADPKILALAREHLSSRPKLNGRTPYRKH